ncbi:hypothetical protein M5689_001481 [Euphorbia peplus]|nr:hypothetical protein M5689_001481 [Euphorbia peplus]
MATAVLEDGEHRRVLGKKGSMVRSDRSREAVENSVVKMEDLKRITKLRRIPVVVSELGRWTVCSKNQESRKGKEEEEKKEMVECTSDE